MRNDELLQSEEWMRFQEAAGYRIVRLASAGWSANGIVHTLPIAGKYLYVPRGPRGSSEKREVTRLRPGLRWSKGSERERGGHQESEVKQGKQAPAPLPEGSSRVFEGEGREDMRGIIKRLLSEAREMHAGWIRIEPESEAPLAGIREAIPGVRVTKAPHDMQPREVFRVSLAPAEEDLLAGMKSKTRYNIRVAEKRGVKTIISTDREYVDAFIRLVTGTADRKGITPHPRKYYEKMCEVLLGEHGKIFAAEKDGEIITANLFVFHGDTATYLHGGSDERFRADMAPFLLQWEAMREAKRRGCLWYDFGGVNMAELEAGAGKWYGITRFKTGFSPATPATVYPGAYDIVLSLVRYTVYRVLQGMKSLFR